MASGTAWLLSTANIIDLDGPLSAALVAKLTASSLAALTVAFAFVAAASRAGVERGAVVALGFGMGTISGRVSVKRFGNKKRHSAR